MILKMHNPNTYGYTVIADVERYSYQYVTVRCTEGCGGGNSGCDKCPELPEDISLLHQDKSMPGTLTHGKDESLSAVELWIKTPTHEGLHYIECSNTFVMNESGKTIERF